MRRVRPVAVQLVRRLESPRVLPLEDASIPDKARKATGGIRTTTEAKQEQLVADLEVVDHEHVGFLNLVREAHTQATAKPVVVPAGANAPGVEHLLLHAEAVAVSHRERHFRYVGCYWYALVRLVRRIPRSIAADYEPLRHASAPHGPLDRSQKSDITTRRREQVQPLRQSEAVIVGDLVPNGPI